MYPLNSLRAFEASARHQSFVKAAEELFVTPGAVSQQVKKLEEYLGVVLFKRMTRSVMLTDEGKILSEALGDVFFRLDKVMQDIKVSEHSRGIDLTVAPIFAIKWLVPRLSDFQTRHKKLDLRIVSAVNVIDFKQDGFDAAIRFSNGQHPGCKSVKLFDEFLTPLCSPIYLQQHGPITQPEDLLDCVLLHDDSVLLNQKPVTWTEWFDEAGVVNADTNRGPRFGQPDHALQAAINGLGVALGWQNMAQEDSQKGWLVAPLDLSIKMEPAFYLVYPEAYEKEPKIQALQQWLLDCVKQKENS